MTVKEAASLQLFKFFRLGMKSLPNRLLDKWVVDQHLDATVQVTKAGIPLEQHLPSDGIVEIKQPTASTGP